VINALHSFYCHNVVIDARDQLATIAWGLRRSVTEIAAGVGGEVARLPRAG